MITFDNVCKKFGSKYALENICLHIPQGTCVGIIGVSGAGKTTLIKLASGLLSPDSGLVRTIHKDPIIHRKSISKNIGVLMANVSLLSKFDTIQNNFKLLKSTFKLPEEQFCSDYSELSLKLGFDKFQNQLVNNLSLGQRMRAELGAVLIHRPSILILDEPTVGLDENAKDTFREIIKEQNDAGVTVILTTHDMWEVSKLCQRIALLDNGKLIYYGSEYMLSHKFTPVNTINLRFEGTLPDLQDIPFESYTIDGNILNISYNTNHITSAEIIKLILQQAYIEEVKIHKPALSDIVSQIYNKGD